MNQGLKATNLAPAGVALSLSAAISVALGSGPAWAQQESASERGRLQTVEEILVTATRRGETDIQRTPISITAIGQDDIDRLFLQGIGDIAILVPNLVDSNAAAFKSFNPLMRGVAKPDIIVYVESPVGVAIDGFFLPHVQSQAIQPFDIESVEVLRGPQGTLFGKNTTAGVINVRTIQPRLDEVDFELRGSFGQYGLRQGNVAVNLGAERVALRFAGVYTKTDGFYRNGKISQSVDPLTGLPVVYAGDGRRLMGEDVFASRTKLLWVPNDSISATLTHELIRDSGDAAVAVNVSPADFVFPALGFVGVTQGDPLKQSAISPHTRYFDNARTGHQTDVDGLYLNLEIQLGGFRVNSLTGYREEENLLASTFMGEARDNLFDSLFDNKRETFQQELTVRSEWGSALSFVAGAYFQEDKTEFNVLHLLGFLDYFGEALRPNTLLGGAGLPLLASNSWNDNATVLSNKQRAKATALFFDAEWEVSEKFRVGVGFRWTKEEKNWAGRPEYFFQFLDGIDSASEGLFDSLGSLFAAGNRERFPLGWVDVGDSWTEPSWRITASYDLADDLFVWATRARSFKSGAFNDQTGTSAIGLPIEFADPRQLAPIDPEIANSLELGLKGEAFGRALRFSVVGFDVTYDDAQRQANTVFELPGGGEFQETRFFNAAELNVRGLELEAAWIISDAFRVGGHLTWQRANYRSFNIDTNFDGTPDLDLSDRRVNLVPNLSGGLVGSYEHGLWDGRGQLRHSLFFNFTRGSIYTYSDLGPDSDALTDTRGIVDFSSTYFHPSDRVTVSLFGKNLTDRRYKVSNLSVGALWHMANFGPPRWFGAEIAVKF